MMKKRFLIFLLILCISVCFISLLQKEKEIKEYFEKENVELAIYLNDEESSAIPLKDTGYIFDEEKSSCTNNANVSWDNESWSPVVENMSEYKTRCTLVFRDYYRVSVVDDGNTQVYESLLSEASTSIIANSDHTLLQCNQGVELANNNGNIFVKNIQNDITCQYYDSTVDAVSELDDSENYFIYLKDEEVVNDIIINEDKILTMDLSGHSINAEDAANTEETGVIQNYGKLNLLSSSDTCGTLHSILAVVSSYESSRLVFKNIEVSSSTHTVHIWDTTDFSAYESRILSIDPSTASNSSSSLWLHGGNTTTKIFNSYIEGPYGIGGQGGKTLIDSSEIVGNSRTALQVNRNFYGDATIVGNSKLTGVLSGVHMYEGTLTLESDENSLAPVIKGTNNRGISLGTVQESVLNFYAGDIYGNSEIYVNGTINVLTGKTLTTVRENEIYHTYLK